jgi:SAM-dependent methyltransferase
MKNVDLQEKYESIYGEGSSKYFSITGFSMSKLIIDLMPSWDNLDVLDIGCGEGRLAAILSFAGARKVDGIDYSSEAINIAKKSIRLENVSFTCGDYRSVDKQYDVVVLQGVLEHFDNSFEALEYIIETNLKNNGKVILTTPSFLNPRGYVWMTLQLLFNVPMSLTDLNFMCPFDFEDFCKSHGYTLEEIKSTEQDWGSGERAIIDLSKRLPNALKDAGMSYSNSNLDRLLEWLSKAVKYHRIDDFSGAIVGYKISKRET